MLPSRVLSTSRTRIGAAAVAIFSLVALGGVAAAPASAEVNSYVAVYDNSAGGGAYGPPYQSITLHQVGGGSNAYSGDYSNGFNVGLLPDGDYYVTVPNSSYAPSGVIHMDGSTTIHRFYVDKFRVTGSIPADAGNSATTVNVEQLISGAWTFADSGTVTSTTGQFEFRLPNGPAEYRLRFLPSSSTSYLETYSSAFTIDGSVPSTSLGAIALNQARSISGTVLRSDGTTPIAGATAYASINGTDVASATSDAQGLYRIVLPSNDATYKVRVVATGFLNQEWNVVTPGSDTVAINATAGYRPTGVDFSLVGAPVTISGTIYNPQAFNGATVKVELFSGGATPALVATTTMANSGAYNFAGVPSGDYFVKITPAVGEYFIETLLGDSNYTAWAMDAATASSFGAAHSFTADGTVPSSLTGHNASLDLAAMIEGVLIHGERIPGTVVITDVNDSAISVTAEVGSDGILFQRVPTGGTYTMYADAGPRYIPQWWSGSRTEAGATPIGPLAYGSNVNYPFLFDLAPATLNVDAAGVTSAGPITVHAFHKDFNGEWKPVGEKTTDPANGDTSVSFTRNYVTGVDDGLEPGDYRVRFEAANGVWLAASSYTAGLTPPGTSGTGPVCSVDVAAVADGEPAFINATFSAGAAAQNCGPQQHNYGDVEGTIVSAGVFGSVPVVGHKITLINGNSSRSSTTGSDGGFSFSLLPNDDYTIEVEPTAHVDGEHEYRYRAEDVALGNGDVDMGPLIATRYGNAVGQITNWPVGMTGTAAVYREGTCGCWNPGPLSVDIAADGSFEVPGIDVTGRYGVLVTFDETYAPVFLGGGFPTPTSPFPGIAQQDYIFGPVAVELNEYVTISGTVMFGDEPVTSGIVIAYPEGDEQHAFGIPTDSTGSYEVEVAPNVDYQVIALDVYENLLIQSYNGHNYPRDFTGTMDYDPVPVDAADVTGINFALVTTEEVTFDLYTGTWNAADDDYDDRPGVDVHLYERVAGAWQQVVTLTSDEDAYAYAENLGAGNYRLRFSEDGEWLALDGIYAGIEYPYTDDAETERDFDPARCYYDLGAVKGGSYVYAELSLVSAPVGSECGADAPVVIPPPAGPPTTTKGATTASVIETIAEEIAEETVEDEPSEPTDNTDEPTDAGPVDAAPAANAPDLTWLFVVSGVVVLLILAGGAVYFVRRRV